MLVVQHSHALLLGQLLGDGYFDGHVVVSLVALVGGQLLDSVVRYFLFVVVLGPRSDSHPHVSVQGLHLDFRAQNCLPNRDIKVGVNVGSLSLEKLVWLDLQVNQQIASCCASDPSVALLLHAKVYTAIHASWDLYLLLCLPVLNAPASTLHARVSDDGAHPVAARACLLHHEGSLLYR